MPVVKLFFSELEWTQTPSPLEDALAKKLADKYHKTPAQILIRYLLQRGFSPIPKSVNSKRIEENWNVIYSDSFVLTFATCSNC